MAEATKYFHDLGVEVMRQGRAGGGSQFHLYVWAPDEQIFELYYGIEQISWNGYARPVAMRHGNAVAPSEPQLPDFELISNDIKKGISVLDGRRCVSELPLKYNVDGVLLPQPFKITRVGPVKLFVDDYEELTRWHMEVLGFSLTEEVEWQGDARVLAMSITRLVFSPNHWRKKLGLAKDIRYVLRVAARNYQQLKTP
jgi:hypothetical protein